MEQKERIAGWLFILPAFVGFLVFALFPLLRGIYLSFTSWSMLGPAKGVGLANYEKMLTDRVFWSSLGRTAYYVVLEVPVQASLALVLAVLLNKLTRSTLVRSILIMPYLVSGVVAALLGVILLHPSLGFLNLMMQSVGLPRQPFFGSPKQAMPTVALVNIWRDVGYNSLFFFAGLQAIPRNIYEAAAIDGASEVKQFFRITIPLLRPIIAFVLVTSVIGSFQIFDTISVATGGGPGESTRTVLWYIYELAFSRLNMGYASALSVAVLVAVVVISVAQMRLLRADRSDLA